MASKRRFSYRWRIFVPMLGMMLGIIGVLVFFQYKRESTYRHTEVVQQLDFINSRIVNAYQRGVELRPFLNFITSYYDGSDLEGISVNVYSSDGQLLYNVGLPILQDFPEVTRQEEYKAAIANGSGMEKRIVGGKPHIFLGTASPDGEIFVHTSMPYTTPLLDMLAINPDFWRTVAILIVATVFGCIFSTRYLVRNIRLLQAFADRAARNEGVFDADKFPHDELGDISRQIVKIYHDKDEAVHRSEKEHKIALHAVEEKSRLKRELTNNINHELKTPIGVIKGYLDTIASNPDMDAATRDRFIARSRENVDRLCSLLSDVSAMTRLEEGAGNVPVTGVDFHDLVFTIENDLTASGMAGNMAFNYNLPLDCIVKGNGTLLVGMVSNLIKNAAQHSHGTEMGLRLIVESEKYYAFGFYDNGTGVEPQHLPHLFERFYRIDAGRSRKVGGTGLGLPIVKNTVEALGGTITARNRSEGGLEFLFTLEKWRGRQ